ncbi:DNA-binding storekeeper protein-relatedtranscriptional regulator [Striga asiatica]|uniref:DNA-binding storekeeper protein-relatedtranscriptional regulator n=1 Tax=Striga asiatica TaxID=4170 RepID=A0A5A7QS31_STRAF|nr:DNA-binding storekeeper protein-relatedtranscriptional regulator [Striga asiatica]
MARTLVSRRPALKPVPEQNDNPMSDNDSSSPNTNSNSSASRTLSLPKPTRVGVASGLESEIQSAPDCEEAARVRSVPTRPRSRPRLDLGKRAALGGPSKDARRLKGLEIRRRTNNEHDDVILVRGLIEYLDRVGSGGRFFDLHPFHKFIRGRFACEPTPDQLHSMISRIRANYRRNMTKEAKRGRAPRGAHQQLVYELSKLVWGGDEPRWMPRVKMVKKRQNGLEEVGPSEGPDLNLDEEDDLEEIGPSEGPSPNRDEPKEMGLSQRPDPNREEASLWRDDGSVVWGKVAEVMDSQDTSGVAPMVERLWPKMFGGVPPGRKAEDWRKVVVKDIYLYIKKTEIKVGKANLVGNVLKAI